MTKQIWMGTYYRWLLLKRLGFSKLSGANLLEIGCHDGFIINHFCGSKKTGIDLEPVKLYPQINYLQGDFLEHDFKGQEFDLIISLEVMEHVKYPARYLQNLDKILAPGGKALLSVPSKQIKIFPYLFQSYIDKRWGHNFRRGHSVTELHQLLQGNLSGRKYKLIAWNCPLWRTIYIPLKLLWNISPAMTKRVLDFTITFDHKFRKGRKGFFYV